MKVFISWAKEPSKTVAEALRAWLPDILQSVQPFVSSADIDAGSRWSNSVASALADTSIGIVCVTATNQHDPWLTFEAGALSKKLENSLVCTYLIGLNPGEMAAGPLTQFQAKVANKQGTFELVTTINKALGTEALEGERLQRLFERAWPDFERQLLRTPKVARALKRGVDEVLEEVVDEVRSIARRLDEAVRQRDADGVAPIPVSPATSERSLIHTVVVQSAAFRLSVRGRMALIAIFEDLGFEHVNMVDTTNAVVPPMTFRQRGHRRHKDAILKEFADRRITFYSYVERGVLFIELQSGPAVEPESWASTQASSDDDKSS